MSLVIFGIRELIQREQPPFFRNDLMGEEWRSCSEWFPWSHLGTNICECTKRWLLDVISIWSESTRMSSLLLWIWLFIGQCIVTTFVRLFARCCLCCRVEYNLVLCKNHVFKNDEGKLWTRCGLLSITLKQRWAFVWCLADQYKGSAVLSLSYLLCCCKSAVTVLAQLDVWLSVRLWRWWIVIT